MLSVNKYVLLRVVYQTPAPGAEDAEPVILTPVGLPCLERGRLYKKESDITLPLLHPRIGLILGHFELS